MRSMPCCPSVGGDPLGQTLSAASSLGHQPTGPQKSPGVGTKLGTVAAVNFIDLCKLLEKLAPRAGLEPATLRLTVAPDSFWMERYCVTKSRTFKRLLMIRACQASTDLSCRRVAG